MSDQTRKDKKAMFEANSYTGGKLKWIVVAVVLAVSIGLGTMVLNKPEAPVSAKGGTHYVEKVSYQGKRVTMNKTANHVDSGAVVLSLEEIKKSDIIYTEYKSGDKTLPLTAYVSPNGRVVTAVSVCEPCNGYTFHMQGNDLVCDSCGTRWDLDSLKGKSGGCMDYPPDELPYKVSGDKVMIDEMAVKNWKTRV